MSLLNDSVMWEAVETCDSNYDGLFLYAVKTTKIFCRPSCKSRPPLRKNTIFFSVSAKAVKEGFRPCKRCRPDLIDAPNDSLVVVELAKELIEARYSSSFTLDELAKEVGMSKFHLQRLFKEITDLSPQKYQTRARMLRSVHLIENTSDSITDIAHVIGYKSSAYFSEVFYRYYGCTPTEFRKRRDNQ
ncbi:bifunctional transcriptional activator/DNA repair enzyme AdaA [Bacillus pinisoli]|uniref:bifunctional transcriptional activator/DNA repair enzyme AdaA n=1 Tax=Bacillus pinisoli TaxID=2901866 RepID=UPI001FF43FF6|nr:Ada metal-binding domain-containing protein [Bacillus pinisoli]